METIVAGRFETFEQANKAAEHLVAAGFRDEDASAFFVNPPGQHAQFPVGGDQYADAHATVAGSGAVAGAVAGGAAAGLAAAMAVPGLNVAVVLGVIGVGAYTGSLAGTLARLGPRKPPEESQASPGRPAGVLVAVRTLSEEAEEIAVDVLRREGAIDIEHAKGVWQDGEWKDFDPLAPVDLVDKAAR